MIKKYKEFSRADERIFEVVEKTIEKMPLPEEKKIAMAEQAGEFEKAMKERYEDLVGQGKEFEQEGLYRCMLRDMMQKVGWLSSEVSGELEKIYKKDGRIDSLSEINKKYFTKEAESKKISDEAENFENMALFFMKYSEGGLISPQYFLKHLFSHLESEAIRKKTEELKSVPQKKSTETEKSELEKTEEERKDEAFLEMLERQRSQYVVEKQGLQEKNITDRDLFEKDKKSLSARLRKDPAIAADLDRWAGNYGEMNSGIEELADLQAGKAIRQAQLSGLHQHAGFHF